MDCRLFTILFLSVLATLTLPIAGYPSFQFEIPNGNSVPDPFNPGETWPGVGHVGIVGGGARNQFGKDFKAAGRTWTVALCNMDSDGDGLSNGAELGDPDCVWTNGATPAGPATSHPGIASCETEES